MFNLNSPLVQNMMVGGYNIPPSPIGATASIGGSGYNNNNYGYMGGYYNNNYAYYNPYLAARQQEIAMAKQREYQRQSSDSMKALTRAAHKSMGMETNEEALNNRYDPQELKQITPTEQTYNNLLQFTSNQGYAAQQEYMKSYYQNVMLDQARDAMPNDISLEQFFNGANQELANIEIQDLRLQSKAGISNLYNSNEYKQLIQMNSQSSSYFSSMYNNNGNEVSISDMSVVVPGAKPTPYNVRRQAFIDAILHNNK